MLPDGRRLGAHLPLGDGMVKAADRAHAIGAGALQVFADNPTAWRRRAAPPDELPAFRARLVEHDIAPISIHASYLVNLAGPEPDLFERSVDRLAAELRTAPTFGARFVNVHIGSHRGAGVAVGIERIAEGVARAIAAADAAAEPGDPAAAPGDPAAEPGDAVAQPGDPAAGSDRAMLVLENSAGSGWSLGVDLDELAAISEAIVDRGISTDRVGFCLDTAHAWGAGIDLGDPAAIDAFLSGFADRIGGDRLVLVHLNDSRAACGSRLDRHEHIGAGRIGATGLRHLLGHPSLAHVAYILETPGMDEGYDAINLDRARRIALGEPLEPLPPEAFELGGSARARTAPA